MKPQRARPFGRYELLAEIGRGGMAELFLARLDGVGGFSKLVAVKLILPHLSEDPRFVEMFLNEGRIAARLNHPNVCQVHELGEVDGELFLSMEYLEGSPWGELAAQLAPDPSQRLRIVASVIAQACEGLRYAHELHDALGNATPIVHRDISPQNLFVTTTGACKLLDFGVSKMVTDQQTRGGMIKGKLAYMPPEQIRGDAVDPRADIFATGVVLWESLTGRRLFLRNNDYLISRAILDEPIPSVNAFGIDFGPTIERAISRALARDRNRRQATVDELADEIRRAAEEHGGLVPERELGLLVRGQCADQLAMRSRLVADVTAVEEVKHEPPAAVTVTRSVALRGGGSIAVERAPSRRWPLLLLAVAGVAGIAIAIATQRHTPAASEVTAPQLATAEPAVSEAAIEPANEPANEQPAREPSEIVMEADRSPPSRPARAGARVAVRKAYYSVDSRPYATIYIDGKRHDQTPLFRVVLAPGRHRVRAVLADGRARDLTIQLEPGGDFSSGTLSW